MSRREEVRLFEWRGVSRRRVCSSGEACLVEANFFSSGEACQVERQVSSCGEACLHRCVPGTARVSSGKRARTALIRITSYGRSILGRVSSDLSSFTDGREIPEDSFIVSLEFVYRVPPS